MSNFNLWWSRFGSGVTPKKGGDYESHAKKVAGDAWAAAINIDEKQVIESFIEFLDVPSDVVTPSFLQTRIVDFLDRGSHDSK